MAPIAAQAIPAAPGSSTTWATLRCRLQPSMATRRSASCGQWPSSLAKRPSCSRSGRCITSANASNCRLPSTAITTLSSPAARHRMVLTADGDCRHGLAAVHSPGSWRLPWASWTARCRTSQRRYGSSCRWRRAEPPQPGLPRMHRRPATRSPKASPTIMGGPSAAPLIDIRPVGLHDQIVGWALRAGAVLPEAGNTGIDKPFVAPAQHLVAYAQPLSHATPGRAGPGRAGNSRPRYRLRRPAAERWRVRRVP